MSVIAATQFATSAETLHLDSLGKPTHGDPRRPYYTSVEIEIATGAQERGSGVRVRLDNRSGSMARLPSVVRAAILLQLSMASHAIAQCEYTVEVIRYSTCPYTATFPHALSEGGHVGGEFHDCGALSHERPFIWSQEEGFRPLDLLGAESGVVRSISRDGTALGTLGLGTPIVWHPDGTPELLPEPPAGLVFIGELAGISSDGRFIGMGLWEPDAPEVRAALLTDLASYTIIDVAPYDSPRAKDVNSEGALVGDVGVLGKVTRAVYISDEHGTRFIMPPSGFERADAFCVNANGVVGGRLMDSDGRKSAFIASDSKSMTILPPPLEGVQAVVYDLNATGTAIVSVNGSSDTRLWINGAYIDPRELMLNPPAGVEDLSGVWRINDAGQLIGTAVISGDTVGLLFTPVSHAGDVTGDCRVGVADLTQLLGDWGDCDACASDLNGDSTVNTEDLLEVLGNWD